jgi:hypothetical protein
MSSPDFMCKNRHGIYYARFVIPKSLRQHFDDRKEIRRSLGTDSRKLAIKKARAFRVLFENIIDRLTIPNEQMKTKLITFVDLNLNTVTVDTGNHKDDAEIYNLIKPLESESEKLIRERRSEEIHQAQLLAIATPALISASPAKPSQPILKSYQNILSITSSTKPQRALNMAGNRQPPQKRRGC